MIYSALSTYIIEIHMPIYYNTSAALISQVFVQYCIFYMYLKAGVTAALF